VQRFYVGLSQPLLKNLGAIAQKRDIRVAEKTADASRALYHQAVMDQVANVMATYWDLVGSIRNLEVQQTSLKAALELERVNRVRVETGTAARADLLQATARVAERRSNVIAAKSRIINNQDRLLALVNWNHESRDWNRPIFPTNLPTNYDLDLQVDDDLVVAEAINSRPDYRASQLRVEIAEIVRDVADWQRLPELNAFAEMGLNGLDEGRSHAFDDVKETDYPDYVVGLEFRYPIPNRRARYEYQRSRYAQDQAERFLEQMELNIVTQVRAAARSIRTAQDSIEAANAQVAASEETLNAEQKRLEVGASTTFNVLEFQEDLARAQVTQILALVNYQQGLIELHRSQGTLLEQVEQELGLEIALEDEIPQYEKPAWIPLPGDEAEDAEVMR
jgi:outer membrane protein TolC